jgi:hypothetical protein
VVFQLFFLRILKNAAVSIIYFSGHKVTAACIGIPNLRISSIIISSENKNTFAVRKSFANNQGRAHIVSVGLFINIVKEITK